MAQYSEPYLKIYFDSKKFFDPQCNDKRVREIMMRTKRCLNCTGIEACKLHPEFWVKGGAERNKMNDKFIKGGA